MAKSRIVVIGAGLAGLPAAYALRETLKDRADILVVNPLPQFQFVPSNPWIAVGWRKLEQTSVALEPALSRRGINFVCDTVVRLRPEARQVDTSVGKVLDYEYCVITTGPELAFDGVPGLGPDAALVQSICTSTEALRCFQAYERFLDAPGPIVIGAVQGASCFGPAYEFAMILDHDLRKRGKRSQASITFVTSEPYVGHLGLGGVGNSQGILENALRQRDIRFVVNASVDNVNAEAVTVTEHDKGGKAVNTMDLPMKFSMLIPSFRGVEAVREVPGLSNPKGFVLIDGYQRNPTYPEIYSAGVCIAIAPLEKTPVPVGVPKTGFMIESMVSAIAQNIRLSEDGKPPQAQATWNALCLADMGTTGAAFLAMPQNPPRNVTWVKEGHWVRTSKVLFEKYFLRKMRLGKSEPGYERLVMKMLGVTRLKENRRVS